MSRNPEGGLQLQPYRTLTNDAEGRAYAAKHGLEFPYPNDYLDVAAGLPVAIELAPGTLCTGVILVQYVSALRDHVVRCAKVIEALDRRAPRIRVAVWRLASRTFQVSELYRP